MDVRYRVKEQEKVRDSSGVSKVAYNDTLTKEEKELNKCIRKPFSRRFGKNLQIMDKLTSNPEYVKALYIQQLKQSSNGDVDTSSIKISDISLDIDVSEEEHAEFSFIPMNLDAFKEAITDMVAEAIRKEEEEKSGGTICSECGYPDCSIHTLDKHGHIIRHFKINELSSWGEDYVEVEKILLEKGGYINAYHGRVVHHNYKGDVIKEYKLDVSALFGEA